MSAMTARYERRWVVLLALGMLAVSSCSTTESGPRSTGASAPLDAVTPTEVSDLPSMPSKISRDADQGDDVVAPAIELPVIDGETIRGGVDYDYNVASSVSDAAAQAEVVAVGSVVSWSDGRLVQDGDELLKYALLEVRVATSFSPSKVADTLFIEVPRGGTLIDDTGAELKLEPGARYVQRSIEELRRAAPTGARVLVLGVPAPSDDEIDGNGDNHILRGWESPLEDSVLWAPVPQGLLFENADGGYVSGIADQHDVEHGEWPIARAAESPFGALLNELATAFDVR